MGYVIRYGTTEDNDDDLQGSLRGTKSGCLKGISDHNETIYCHGNNEKGAITEGPLNEVDIDGTAQSRHGDMVSLCQLYPISSQVSVFLEFA